MRKIIRMSDITPGKDLNRIVIRVSHKLLIILIFFMLFSVFTAFKVKHDNIIMLKKTYNSKYAEVQVLKEKIRELEVRIEELNSPEGIGKEARKRLNMVRKGEKIIRPVYRD